MARADGETVGRFLSVAAVLRNPRLARVYAYVRREGDATVGEVIDTLELPQGTAYEDVNRLTERGLLRVTDDRQPRRYAASDVEITVTEGDDTYRITPALIDAVGRRETDPDIDAFADRHGIDRLAAALSWTRARERGEVTHRTVARELDVSPITAETVLQALRPVVRDHADFGPRGASLEAVTTDDS